MGDTGIRHNHASGEYTERRRLCELAAAKLGVISLRQADLARLADRGSALTDREQACAWHVIAENSRTQWMAQALAVSDLDLAGRLMLESHASLRDKFRVSCPELDTLVEIAGAAPGAYGARMTGGGFGGCVVALVDPDAVRELSARWSDGFRAAHRRECRVFRVIASDGAAALPISSGKSSTSMRVP